MEHAPAGIKVRLLATVMLTVAGGAVGLLPPADTAAATPLSCPAEALTRGAASFAAMRCGSRVEVADARTERSQLFAEASGAMTLVTTVVPVRVRKPDGRWAAIDTTLARRVDGSVAPGATLAPVRFSSGGSAPLVTLERDGRVWTMSWPSPLPAPELRGDTATYPEVLPGVDLAVRATAEGFTHVLVVKSAQAAANPAVREVAYRIDAGTATVSADGRVLATAQDGTLLATGVRAEMWDSSGAGDPEGFTSSVAGPGARAKRATLGVRGTGRDLVVVADQSVLTDPGTRYPVYVDPEFVSYFSRWAYANKSNVNNGDGRAWVGRDPDTGNLYRSFFEFDTRSLAGTHILSASLNVTLSHSWACTDYPVFLHRAGGITGTPRSVWNTMPVLDWIDGQSAHAHKGPNACGDQPDAPMTFGGNLGGWLQNAANGNWPTFTVVFCACSDGKGSGEATTERWKKFRVTTIALHVTYNSYPATGSSLATVPAAACATGAARPAINTWTPQLTAVMADADAGATVAADFQYSVNNGATWTGLPRTAPQASGLTHQVTLPDLSAGAPAFISWRVIGWDGTDTSWSWSPVCEFTVDTSPPAGPVLQPGAALPPYPITPPSTVVVGTPVNVPVTAGGSTDVVGYWYTVSTSQVSPPRQSFVAAGAGGSAVLPVTPVVSGVSANWLTVQSVDRAGNFSAEVAYQFRANPAG